MTTTFVGHFLGPDIHASRPAAAGLPEGTMYVCTTHNKIERVVSAAWVDYATLGSGLTVASDGIWDTKGDLAAATGPDAATKLPVGSNGQVLQADSTQATGIKWTTLASGGVVADTIWDTKGDMAVATGPDAASKLAVGTNGQVLTADNTQTTGVKWAAAGGGGGMTKLFDTTLAVDTASIDTGAGGIAGGYAVLQVFMYVKSDDFNLDTALYFRVNNDSGANYDWQRMSGSGASATVSFSAAGTGWTAQVVGTDAHASAFGMVELVIPHYANTVAYKAGRWTEGFADPTNLGGRAGIKSGTWRSTAAISRLSALPVPGTAKFKAGTRLTIFGLN